MVEAVEQVMDNLLMTIDDPETCFLCARTSAFNENRTNHAVIWDETSRTCARSGRLISAKVCSNYTEMFCSQLSSSQCSNVSQCHKQLTHVFGTI